MQGKIMPVWSIVIGLLVTALKVSFSIKSNSEVQVGAKVKNKTRRAENNIKQLLVKWKGASKMTIGFAAFMVSIGIPGRDSEVCD